MKVFPTIFSWWWQYPDPDPYRWLTDPGPGGPETYGSGTLGITKFFSKPIIRHFLRLDPKISILYPFNASFFFLCVLSASLVRGGTVSLLHTSDIFPTIFAWWWKYPDLDPYHWLPDPEGPKAYGSGSGRLGIATFFYKPVTYWPLVINFLRLDPRSLSL